MYSNTMMNDACSALCKTFVFALLLGILITTLVLKGIIQFGIPNRNPVPESNYVYPEDKEFSFFPDQDPQPIQRYFIKEIKPDGVMPGKNIEVKYHLKNLQPEVTPYLWNNTPNTENNANGHDENDANGYYLQRRI